MTYKCPPVNQIFLSSMSGQFAVVIARNIQLTSTYMAHKLLCMRSIRLYTHCAPWHAQKPLIKNSSEVFDSLTVCFNSTNCNGQNGELLAKRHKWMYVEFTNIQLTHYQYVIIFTSQTNFTCYLHFVPSNSPHWCIIEHPEFTFVHLDHFKISSFFVTISEWISRHCGCSFIVWLLFFVCFKILATQIWCMA